ncbi:pectate lyase [Streptomyces sp. NPDC058657]|uniref:pectate lyase n=1 Tax=unclassified Streptomyces TaxID=2593676 RepID=UPI00365036F8
MTRTPQASPTPHSHRRRTARRRAVLALAGVGALTAGALVTTGLLPSADAAKAPVQAKASAAAKTPAAAKVAQAPAAWPRPAGSAPVPATIKVSGTYDGKLKRHFGTGDLGGGGQGEGQDPVFELADGAVLKNVVIGSPAADGVHCLGSCTIQNVWWEDVGEDAATFKGKSAQSVYTVYGGGARKASDKVLQFNGAGKLVVSKFQVADFGKLVRSCGNCKTQHRRTILVNDVDVSAPGGSLVGINTNYGDSVSLRNVRIHGDAKKKIKPCVRFTGNNTGKEPVQTGTGPDGTHCRYQATDVTYH